jgi:hypothetical protein
MVKNFFVLETDGTATLHMAGGHKTKLDFKDWLEVCGNTWRNCKGYAYTTICSKIRYVKREKVEGTGGKRTLSLHLLLTKYKRTDHINGDKSDNRRDNLRPVTTSQNAVNSKKRVGGSSKWKGVSKVGNKWYAAIGFQGKVIKLGSYEEEGNAAMAYNEAALALFGSYARLNDSLLN